MTTEAQWLMSLSFPWPLMCFLDWERWRQWLAYRKDMGIAFILFVVTEKSWRRVVLDNTTDIGIFCTQLFPSFVPVFSLQAFKKSWEGMPHSDQSKTISPGPSTDLTARREGSDWSLGDIFYSWTVWTMSWGHKVLWIPPISISWKKMDSGSVHRPAQRSSQDGSAMSPPALLLGGQCHLSWQEMCTALGCLTTQYFSRLLKTELGLMW